ncbi:MurR/RpiR family transcriptional regulator [Burkholderiales bacterium YL45]|uniref:MurR/RpiR family transcriptional regulator n=1 Tax=Turicimonas muris TaxID=1796652 RepID=A0A227KRP5_9BURK|nr:MurR/RpiR family transcriptional regulator [Turicimonas muris]ANU65351.1 MurR/RpiR family transcriptional regulator [Burkholderiales bacterium YL45]OXE51156.1 MurR/RpiR family transcriptional regulator [Turicimonas muris]QQQ96507.1 MurR/RpiR family transcriptional regulator [Turicimonas muris]
MVLLENIRENLKSYSSQQRKLASYILENYKAVAFMTTTELSLKSGVSNTTINRFCVSLGFKGYSDFQSVFQEVLQSELTAVDRVQQTPVEEDTLDLVFNKEAEQLAKAVKSIGKKDYTQALAFLLNARKIIIVGQQASEPVALYGAYSLGKIRPNVEYMSLSSLDAVGRLQTLGEDDVTLFFGMPRYPKLSLDLLTLLEKQQCKIILVTHSEFSPLLKHAGVSLIVPITYHRFTDGLSPLICLINSFALDIYNANEARGQKSLAFFEEMADLLFSEKSK